eukprot:1647636-Prymnesium_polylepis.1
MPATDVRLLILAFRKNIRVHRHVSRARGRAAEYRLMAQHTGPGGAQAEQARGGDGGARKGGGQHARAEKGGRQRGR